LRRTRTGGIIVIRASYYVGYGGRGFVLQGKNGQGGRARGKIFFTFFLASVNK
jgi:hypothetical protein